MLVVFKVIFTLQCMVITILAVSSGKTRSWHANDQLRGRSTSIECNPFHEQNDQLDLDKLTEKYHLWPTKRRQQHDISQTTGFVSNHTVVYGLEYALDEIWKHQHPSDCSTAKFMIASPHNGGFGSVLHVYGAVLGVAMNLGRVLLPYPLENDAWQFETPHCQVQIDDHNATTTFTTTKNNNNNTSNDRTTGNSYKQNFECYYEPWSSCTIYDALGPDALNILQSGNLPQFQLSYKVVRYFDDEEFVRNIKNDTDSDRVIVGIHNEQYSHTPPPLSLLKMLSCGPTPSHHWYYWWRAISVTYLMRLNPHTRHWLLQQSQAFSHAINDETDLYTAIYVRRGDKDIEMHMVAIEEYLHATRSLWKDYLLSDNQLITSYYYSLHGTNNNTSSHHLRGKSHSIQSPRFPPKRKIFLATEDSHVLEEILHWGNETYRNFTLFPLQHASNRMIRFDTSKVHHSHDSLSKGKKNLVKGQQPQSQKQVVKPVFYDHFYEISYTNLFNRSGLWAEKHILYKHSSKNLVVHHPDEYLSMLLNIHLLVHASGWVCTLASNFCRIVDELRATIGARAHLAFIDLSRESCPSRFCVYEGFKDFGW